MQIVLIVAKANGHTTCMVILLCSFLTGAIRLTQGTHDATIVYEGQW
jgi:hypothetical protein